MLHIKKLLLFLQKKEKKIGEKIHSPKKKLKNKEHNHGARRK